ncbi:hypothetical protein NUH88_03330 [Nisaea acidiphila]|uniref:Uncharacterized protein n=1 Tax=Nisaea acidiphila TaxID=1862145 RepID=A0A9J7ATR1_9PROT|nr:hypothetical protein [Nisaea acidiphila]UUX50736.1 hypothetical protein NUH88_03330 [Nisaea acidiphila]
MQNALYLFLNGAGGLTHDVTVWKEFARHQTRAPHHAEPVDNAPGKFAGLGDAAEQLRRLSRNAKLTAQEAKLLCNALTIVETEAGARRQPA